MPPAGSPDRPASGFGDQFDRGRANTVAITLDWMQQAYRDTAGYDLNQIIGRFSVAERMELLRSIADDAALLTNYVPCPAKPETRTQWAEYCYGACFRNELAATKEDLPALLTFLTVRHRYREDYYQKEVQTVFKLMRQAIKDGGFLTSADQDRLAEYAAILRATADKSSYNKARKRTLMTRAEAVERFAGVETSVTSLLLERCEGADNPYALGPLPSHHDFWCALLGATVDGLHDIMRDVTSKPSPAWLTDRAAFAAAFPACGPFNPRFAAWRDCPQGASRNFAPLKARAKRKAKAYGDGYRRLYTIRDAVAPLLRWQWNGKAIPALDQLGDISDPLWTALIEHLISVPNGPRPTAKWVKQALTLAQAIGTETVEARLFEWLNEFHSPRPTPQALADAHNAPQMDRTVERLNEALADWPALISAPQMVAAGRALAMEIASGGHGKLTPPFSLSLLDFNDHRNDGRSATDGVLHIATAGLRSANGNHSYESVLTWQRVSVENEQILRGALWLLAEMPTRERVIDTLEAIALAATARLRLGEDGRRSKIVANAAIATLRDLGGAGVAPALLRLSREIDDRSISAAALKALNGQA